MQHNLYKALEMLAQLPRGIAEDAEAAEDWGGQMSEVVEESTKFGITRRIMRNGDMWYVDLTANQQGVKPTSFSAKVDDGEAFMREAMEDYTRELAETAARARLPNVGDFYRHTADPADMVKVVDVVENEGGALGSTVVIEWPARGEDARHMMSFDTFETSYERV